MYVYISGCTSKNIGDYTDLSRWIRGHWESILRHINSLFTLPCQRFRFFLLHEYVFKLGYPNKGILLCISMDLMMV